MCDTLVGREGRIFADAVPATTRYFIVKDIMDPLWKVIQTYVLSFFHYRGKLPNTGVPSDVSVTHLTHTDVGTHGYAKPK